LSEEVLQPLKVEVIWIGSLMRVSLVSVGLTFIFCGFRPNFIVLIDCASVAVNVLMALASMSWNPRPPKPGGVVAMYQACSGRGLMN